MASGKRLIDYEQAKRATYEEIFWTESEQAAVRHFLAKLPKVDAVEVVHGERIYNAHEVAVIIADLFRDDCACNFNTLTAIQKEAIKHTVYCACMQWLQQPAEG